MTDAFRNEHNDFPLLQAVIIGLLYGSLYCLYRVRFDPDPARHKSARLMFCSWRGHRYADETERYGVEPVCMRCQTERDSA